MTSLACPGRNFNRSGFGLEAEAGVDVAGVVGHRESRAGTVKVVAVDQLGRLDPVRETGQEPSDL